MMNKLKPCPFCGGNANTYHNPFTVAEHYVSCNNCNAKTDVYFKKKQAIEAWNRRANDEQT